MSDWPPIELVLIWLAFFGLILLLLDWKRR